tara:strand:- start:326 stop:484 length:159 start_codon:yes stop_codon:yes gene_type:complete
MRPFKDVLKDLEEAGMKSLSEKMKTETEVKFGIRNGSWSHTKWSKDLNTNKD